MKAARRPETRGNALFSARRITGGALLHDVHLHRIPLRFGDVMERAIEVYVEHFQDYLEQSTERVILARIPVYVSIPREALHGAIGRSFTAVKEDLERGTTITYPTHLRDVG